ncbi:peptidase S16, lon domain protein [Belliella baltica DSM 15883]|uniref:Peptidase S16, lon domain protein n=1 Tax=Belliella baltica (strain DSM 15883 / CIP 108006 / LMG 21964 / BA134) TaxID=866536 RepID=I3ZAQ7_BELBD|nr:LON peptidase substrate-binding domain-containing protein [Belliella baltica]AFL86325.1 peptidase S16, lon domain protein [Belliella baltica DSM 15883]
MSWKDMTNEIIPIFPLKLVAFPGEHLNLHIFEPRYKQLIADISEGDGRFGVSVYLDKLMPFGSEVHLEEVSKVYEDGRLDIKTKVIRVYELIRFENPFQDKLYAAGEIIPFENDISVAAHLHNEFIFYLKEFFRLIGEPQSIIPLAINSFTLTHKIGLSLEEEYELLVMRKESMRIQFLIKHFIKVIPVLREVERAKAKIRMNGHFKTLDALDF